MAKGARASSRKANNARLKSKVFGPIEHARTQRLSAKLLELAAQPKPKDNTQGATEDMSMDTGEGTAGDAAMDTATENKDTEAMDIDQAMKKDKPRSKPSKGRIEKRRKRRASIVFPTFKNRVTMGKLSRKR